MMIPILPQLESRQEWVAFFQRERPYAQVREPNCRVDLQTTYLQITRLGAQPMRFTLGSKTTLEPVWQIISRCNWSLQTILNGLEGLDNGTTVRDRPITEWSPDLSVRRSIPREQHLYTEVPLGSWPKPKRDQQCETIADILARVAWNEFTGWECELTPTQWLLAAQEHEEGWEISKANDDLYQISHSSIPEARFAIPQAGFAPKR